MLVLIKVVKVRKKSYLRIFRVLDLLDLSRELIQIFLTPESYSTCVRYDRAKLGIVPSSVLQEDTFGVVNFVSHIFE